MIVYYHSQVPYVTCHSIMIEMEQNDLCQSHGTEIQIWYRTLVDILYYIPIIYAHMCYNLLRGEIIIMLWSTLCLNAMHHEQSFLFLNALNKQMPLEMYLLLSNLYTVHMVVVWNMYRENMHLYRDTWPLWHWGKLFPVQVLPSLLHQELGYRHQSTCHTCRSYVPHLRCTIKEGWQVSSKHYQQISDKY